GAEHRCRLAANSTRGTKPSPRTWDECVPECRTSSNSDQTGCDWVREGSRWKPLPVVSTISSSRDCRSRVRSRQWHLLPARSASDGSETPSLAHRACTHSRGFFQVTSPRQAVCCSRDALERRTVWIGRSCAKNFP